MLLAGHDQRAGVVLASDPTDVAGDGAYRGLGGAGGRQSSGPVDH